MRRARSLAAVVVDRDPRPVPDRVGERAQVGDRLAGPEPFAGVEVEALDQARGPRPELDRQRREDLELGGGDDRPEPELGGRSGQSGEEQRLGLLGGHPGQPRPVAVHQPDPAVRAALGVDRHARRAQRLDVAVDRSFGDLELARQLGGGQLAARLEQQQERHEARCTHDRTIRPFLPERVMFSGRAPSAGGRARPVQGVRRCP